MNLSSGKAAFASPVPQVRFSRCRSFLPTHNLSPLRPLFRARVRYASIVRCHVNDALANAGVPVGAAAGIEDLPLEKIPPVGEELPEYWARPGVYGVYSEDGTLRYVAAVADVRYAIDCHRTVLGDPVRVFAARMMTVENLDDAPLSKLAYNWLVAHTNEGPGAPEGNTDGAPEWRVHDMPRKAGGDLYFREGTGMGKEAVEGEIMRILRENKVVLFMKGTRNEPMCGFSEATVELLKERLGDGFECVDCLDDVRNRGLREGIKTYSDWPTIPQLYVNGDFVGGADIVAGMDESGELAAEFENAGVPVLTAPK